MPDAPDPKRAKKRYPTSKVIYAIDYTCGHWEATWRFASTKESCPHCRDGSLDDEPCGQPARVIRYYPRKP